MSSVNRFVNRADVMRRTAAAPALSAPSSPGSAEYLALIQKLMEMRQEQSSGVIAAFTSFSRGQGVTYVIESLAWQLAQHTEEPILLCGYASMAGAAGATFWEPQRIQRLGKGNSRPKIFTKPGWDDLQELRARFGFVLVDCPAVSESPAMRILSTLVDGVTVVVAEGETRREEIEAVHQTLQTCSANVLGLVLNKRTDPVPRVFSKFF